MTIKFCPKCGNIMKLDVLENMAHFVCPRCGYKEEYHENTISERIKGESKVIVLGEREKNMQLLPTTKVQCPNCGGNKAYYWEVQTRSGDEGTTQFFKCVKCGYTWRLYT